MNAAAYSRWGERNAIQKDVSRALVVVVVLGLSGSLAVLFLLRGRTHHPSVAEDFAHLPKNAASPAALWPSPAFTFSDQRGAMVSNQSLLGQPYVANFIFTTCRTVCPLLTTKMVRVQRQLKGAPLRFVSFSVDPEHDTVEALAEYQRQWNPDESRWSLLQTTPTELQRIATAFHVTAQRTDGGLDAVMHSAVFLLVDASGVVRGAYDSEDAEDFKRLVDAARALMPSPPTDAVKVERSGEVLFHELSCSNCHEHPELAPTLGGLLGQRVELETRLLVTADEAYVRESILSPDAKRVAGFPLRMPSYAGHVSDGELTGLVRYVTSLPAPAAPVAGVPVVVDPVCHMKVRVTANALQLPLPDGGVAAFCSPWCRDRFHENPDAYRQ